MNNEENSEEILDFNNPAFTFHPKESHDWRQRGPFLVCKSCEIEHATYIGSKRLMVGLNESGQPIFKER